MSLMRLGVMFEQVGLGLARHRPVPMARAGSFPRFAVFTPVMAHADELKLH